MFKRLKIELFYFREMLRYGYWHPRYWFAYIKNRFFGSWLVARTVPVDFIPDPEFELHILTQKNDLWLLVWAIKSFLHFSDLNPTIVIHDDGSLNDGAAYAISRIFPTATILSRSEAEQRLSGITSYIERVREFRKKGHNLILKFIDIFLLSRGKVVMVLDSDILFLKRPQEIIDFVLGKSLYQAMMSGISDGSVEFKIAVDNEYAVQLRLKERGAGFLNSGLIVYRKEALTVESFLGYFDHIQLSPENYFVEMSGWCCLIAQTKYLLLPPDRYILQGQPDSRTITKHFTNPRRHEFYAYGINLVRKRLRR